MSGCVKKVSGNNHLLFTLIFFIKLEGIYKGDHTPQPESVIPLGAALVYN